MPTEKYPEYTLDFNYIADGIYIGTNKCCEAHFDEELGKEGITADISLEEDRLDTPFGVDFYEQEGLRTLQERPRESADTRCRISHYER